MSGILFMQDFKLAVDPEHDTHDVIEEGINTIGRLSSLASSCANAAAMLKDGSTPSDDIVNNIGYAASVLSNLTQEVSNLLAELRMKEQKLNNKEVEK